MKKLIFLVIISLMIVGCDWQNSDGSYDTSKSLTLNSVTIDSCEYISSYNRLAHKGNCHFCAKRRKKELEELVEQLKEK